MQCTEVRTALIASISRWEKKAQGLEIHETGMQTCPLCGLFIKNECMGCPIYEDTKVPYCVYTPYEDYHRHVWTSDATSDTFVPITKELAQREVSYLKSLLEKLA